MVLRPQIHHKFQEEEGASLCISTHTMGVGIKFLEFKIQVHKCVSKHNTFHSTSTLALTPQRYGIERDT